jgi:putative endonuclease
VTDRRRRLGETGERLARRHLSARGYRVLDRNFRTRHGEIDVVAAGSDCLVFCEVKTRVTHGAPGPFGPLASVGPRKQRQVRRMAAQWLADRSGGGRGDGGPPPASIRFDAIGVTLSPGGTLLHLDHVENAF